MKTKNIILSICCLFATQYGPAQITLEHTYNSRLNILYKDGTFTAIKYYTDVDVETNTFTIYNLDHSIYKFIKLDIPEGSESSSQISLLNINDDPLIEFYYTFHYSDSQNNRIFESVIFNENMEQIQRFPDAYSIIVLHTDVGPKLEVTKMRGMDISTDIYTLQKSGSNTVSPKAESHQYPYPNPAGATITIPYTIPEGASATISIFNAAGQLFETKKVDATFHDLLLNTSHYPQGTYYYTYLTRRGEFIVK